MHTLQWVLHGKHALEKDTHYPLNVHTINLKTIKALSEWTEKTLRKDYSQK